MAKIIIAQTKLLYGTNNKCDNSSWTVKMNFSDKWNMVETLEFSIFYSQFKISLKAKYSVN